MNAIGLFLINQYRILKNSFSLKRLRTGRSLLIFLFLAGYLGGAFEAFLWGFSFLKSFPVIGIPILINLWYFFFFILFLMLIFSNTAIFYSFLHHKEEQDFLFSLPLINEVVFLKWFSECLVFSSWGFLFLSGPLIISVGIVMKAGTFYFFGAVVFLLLFLLVTTGLGIALALILSIVKRKRRNVLLGGLFLVFFMYLLFFALRMPDFIGEGEWPFVVFMMNFFKQLDISQKLCFPSTWVARGLWAFMNNDMRSVMVFGQLLIATAVLFVYVLTLFAGKRLLTACNNVRHGVKTAVGSVIFGKCSLRSALWQFACKDFKVFIRDPGQYIQFIIILALVILYATNLRGLTEFIDRRFWRLTIYFMNISALSLTASAMAIRLLFPQLSLEGKRFWLIGLAPLKKYQFIIGKALPGFLLIIISTGSIMVYANVMMSTSKLLMVFSLIVHAVMVFSLCSLSLGMGMLYPNLRDEDPTKIMSGFGGILTLLLSMLYIALVVSLLAFPVYRFVFRRYPNIYLFLGVEISSVIVVLILSGLFIFVPLSRGAKRLFNEQALNPNS